MILGFAHITNNLSEPLPSDFGIDNPPEKWPLMVRQAAKHWVSFPLPQYRSKEETVQYSTGTVDQPGRLNIIGDYIILDARDRRVEGEFFRDGVGFNANEFCEMELRSAVRDWKVNAVVRPMNDAPIDPPLDIAGYAALAFYCTDVEADRDHLLKHGGRTPTEPFTVKLDREMKIVMLRSPEGTIIELIQVMP